MSILPPPLRDLIDSGPLAHLATLNTDGSPQVTIIWIARDGDDLLSGHLHRSRKIRNIERDPRVVLSFDAPRDPAVFLNEHAVLKARAAVEESDEAWDLLDRMAKVYLNPTARFPAPRTPGFIIRYTIEQVGGVGPWAASG